MKRWLTQATNDFLKHSAGKHEKLIKLLCPKETYTSDVQSDVYDFLVKAKQKTEKQDGKDKHKLF